MLGARHGHTLQRFAERELLDTGGVTSLLATQVFSGVACLRGLPPGDRVESTRRTRGVDGGVRTHAVICAWATQNYDEALQLADPCLQQDPDDAVSHWVRLLTPCTPEQLQAGRFRSVAASYEWLRQHLPTHADVHRLFVAVLAQAQADPRWLDRLLAQIQATSNVAEWVDLAPVLGTLDNRNVVRSPLVSWHMRANWTRSQILGRRRRRIYSCC